MRVPIFRVDAFASHRFAGNPAAVMLLDHLPDDSQPALAAESMRVETAFPARERRLPPALVHSRRRGKAVRSRHAGERGGNILRRVAGDRIDPEGTCAFYLEGTAEN